MLKYPDPHNALTICKQLGVDVRKTVMIGDTPTDIQFGKRVSDDIICQSRKEKKESKFLHKINPIPFR